MKVGANDASGNRASFSNYGANLDVIAPGINDMYICLRNSSNSGYSDVFDFLDINGNPSLINGTSFAAPNASGVAGLLLSEHNINNGYPNNLAPEDVEYFLQSFAKDVQANGYDLFTGSGRVDANASIEKLMLPQYFVKHSGGSNSTTSFPTNLMQVKIVKFDLTCRNEEEERIIS
jgi:serine protease